MVKGKPLIQHLIERVRTAKLPKLIVLCTTIRPEDSVFADIAKKSGIQCFRGSEKDILDRFLNAAIKYDVDFIVNVDGDDIFCDSELIDKTVNIFQKTNSDFIKWNELPLGASPVGIKVKALKKAWEMKDENDTETGWGKYFTDTGFFDVEYTEPEDEELRHPEIRMTLDYPEDLKFTKEIFNRLYQPGKIFTLKEILTLLKKEPHLTEINKGVQQEYWKRFNQRAKIKLRKRS
jgi:spore coat polysaccharide biosynthesis protein SpsF (cytidylyltransferase family)